MPPLDDEEDDDLISGSPVAVDDSAPGAPLPPVRRTAPAVGVFQRVPPAAPRPTAPQPPTGETGGLLPQHGMVPTHGEPAVRPAPTLPARWSADPIEREAQVRQATEADYAKGYYERHPFAPTGSHPKALPGSLYRRMEGIADQQSHQQNLAERAAAVAEKRAGIDEQKARNEARIQEMRGSGQVYRRDEFGDVQPVIETASGKPLYHASTWSATTHPETKLPAMQKRNQYGDIEYKRPPLTLGTDPHDEMLYADMGDGQSLPYMKAKDALNHEDISLQRLGQRHQARRNTAIRSEVLAPLREVRDQASVAVQQAEARRGEIKAQMDNFTKQSGNLNAMASAGGANAAAITGQQTAIAEARAKLSMEDRQLAEALKPMGALRQQHLRSEMAYRLGRAELTRDTFAEQDATIRARLASEGKDPATDPAFIANKRGLDAANAAHAMTVQQAAQLKKNLGALVPKAQGVAEESGEGTLKQGAKAFARGATSEGIYAAGEGASRLISKSPVRTAVENATDWLHEKSMEAIQGFPLTDSQRAARARTRAEGEAQTKGFDEAMAGYAEETAKLRERIRRALPVDQKFMEGRTGQIAQGAGQLAGTLPMALLPGGLPLSAVGQIYQEAYDDATQSGASPEVAHSAAMKYLPAASLDYLSDKLIIGKIMKPMVGRRTVGFVRDVLATTAAEGTTEAAQQLYLNQIASKLEGYDPDRPFDKEVLDSFIVGAAVGGGVTVVGKGANLALGGEKPKGEPPPPNDTGRPSTDTKPPPIVVGPDTELPPAAEELAPEPPPTAPAPAAPAQPAPTPDPRAEAEAKLQAAAAKDPQLAALLAQSEAVDETHQQPTETVPTLPPQMALDERYAPTPEPTPAVAAPIGEKPGAEAKGEAGESPAGRAPSYRYTIQRPEGGAPGYVQIDEIAGSDSRRSTTIEELNREGVAIPQPPDSLPTGQYTLEQVQDAIAKEQPTAPAPTATRSRVRIAGAEFDLVRRNPDGTITVRSENGDEFSTGPDERWEPVEPSRKSQSRQIDFQRTSREDFIRQELDAKERIRKLAVMHAEQAIRKGWRPAKPLPIGVDKVAAFMVRDRLSPEERKLRTTLEIARRNLTADTRADADIAGRVYDNLKAHAQPTSTPQTPTGRENSPDTLAQGQSEPAGGQEAADDIDWHTTDIGRRTIRGTPETLADENAKEAFVTKAIQAAPSYPKLLAAYDRFRRDLNKYDYNPEVIRTRPWELLTAHAGVMNAKSGRAQTLRQLAIAVFDETKLPRKKEDGFRGSDGLDWDRISPRPAPPEAAVAANASNEGAATVVPEQPLTPSTLRGRTLKPNHIYVWGNDWSGRHTPDAAMESFPYDGDPVAALRGADMGGMAAHVIVATDASGRPSKVISPNLNRVADFGTPEADYIAGDVHAPKRAKRQQIEAAVAANDYATAERLMGEEVAATQKKADDYRGYIKEEMAKNKADLAALKAGKTVTDLDFRYGNTPEGKEEYFEQRRRRIQSFQAEIKKLAQEAEQWRGLVPQRAEAAPATSTQPENATPTRIEPQGREPEHPRAAPRAAVPENRPEVREGQGEQAGGGNRAERGAEVGEGAEAVREGVKASAASEAEAARAGLAAQRKRIVEFTKSPLGRKHMANWNETYDQAMREFPKPRADGFYHQDKNGGARNVRQLELLIRRGIPQEAFDSGRMELDFKLFGDTSKSHRQFLQSVAQKLGIETGKSERTTSIAEKLKRAAISNFGDGGTRASGEPAAPSGPPNPRDYPSAAAYMKATREYNARKNAPPESIPASERQSAKAYLKEVREAQEAAKREKPATETIEPSKDTPIGKNDAGESLYQRDDGSVYRMRFDRPKQRPNGYPDFGGDLAPVEQQPSRSPDPVAAAIPIPGARDIAKRGAELEQELQKPPAQMKPWARIAELESQGITTINGKPLSEANAAEIINAVGKSRRQAEKSFEPGGTLTDPTSPAALSFTHDNRTDESTLDRLREAESLVNAAGKGPRAERVKLIPRRLAAERSVLRGDGAEGVLPGRGSDADYSTRALGAVFGKRIQFVEPSVEQDWGAFAIPNRPDTVFVNTQSKAPVIALTGHEMGHTMSYERPDLYGPLSKAVLELAPMPESYAAEKRAQNYSDPSREWVSDQIGARFDEPEFWVAVGKKAKASGKLAEFAKWADGWLTRIASRIRNVLHGSVRAEALANIEALRERIADAFVQYAEDGKPAAILGGSRDIEFSTPSPSGERESRPPSGMTFTGPVQRGGAEFRKRSKSSLGEYEYAGASTNAEKEQYAREFADWHEKNTDFPSALAEMRSIDQASFRAVVAGELLARQLKAETNATNEGDRLIAQHRQNSLWGDTKAEKTEAGQALQAQSIVNEALRPFSALLAWKGFIRQRLGEKIGKVFSDDASSKVKKGILDAGNEAAGALKDSLETPDAKPPKNIEAWLEKLNPTLRMLRNAATERGFKWGDIFNSLPESQEARKKELFERVQAHERLRNLSPENQRRLVTNLDNAWTYLRNQIVRQEFSRLIDLPNVGKADVEKVKSVVGDLIKYSNLGLLDNEAFLNALAGKYGMENMDGPTATKLTDLAKRIQEAKTPAEKSRLEYEMLQRFQLAKGVSPVDYGMATFYSHLLSGITTLTGGNLGGNIAQTLSNLPTYMLARPKRAGAAARGFFAGVPEAVRQAVSILRTGRGGHDPAAWAAEADRDVLELMSSKEAFEELRKKNETRAKVIRAHAATLRYVGRALRATDAMFYYPSKTAFDWVAAQKILEGKYEGAELTAKIREAMGSTREEFEMAKKRAEAEGFNGDEVSRRIAEIISERRRKFVGTEAEAEAERQAQQSTLTGDMEGWAGVVAQGLQHITNKAKPGGVPLGKFVLPIIRMPTNFFNAALNYTIAGAVRARTGEMPTLKESHGERVFRKMTEDERAQLRVQAGIGTALMTGLMLRAIFGKLDEDEDAFDITGTGPKDTAQLRQLLDAGWMPNSIKIGNRRISYANTTLAMPLSIAGNFTDAYRYGSHDPRSLEKQLARAALQSPAIIFGAPALMGLNEIAELTDARNPDASKLENFFARIGTTATVPRLFSTSYQQFVDDTRKRDGMQEYDTMGEEVRRKPFERFMRTDTEDTLRRLLNKRGLVIPGVSRTTLVGGERITPEDYAEYTQKAGRAVAQRLRDELGTIGALPRDEAQKLVDDIAREERHAVLEEIRARALATAAR